MDKTNKPNTEWDPDAEMESLRASLKLTKDRRRWYRSLLDPYTQELTDLAQRGASLSIHRQQMDQEECSRPEAS